MAIEDPDAKRDREQRERELAKGTAGWKCGPLSAETWGKGSVEPTKAALSKNALYAGDYLCEFHGDYVLISGLAAENKLITLSAGEVASYYVIPPRENKVAQ